MEASTLGYHEGTPWIIIRLLNYAVTLYLVCLIGVCDNLGGVTDEKHGNNRSQECGHGVVSSVARGDGIMDLAVPLIVLWVLRDLETKFTTFWFLNKWCNWADWGGQQAQNSSLSSYQTEIEYYQFLFCSYLEKKFSIVSSFMKIP